MCAPSLRTSTLNPALPSPRSKTLDDVRAKLENFDQKIGVQIIQNALRVPMKTIASNAGVEGAVIVGKVREGRLGLSSRGRGGGALRVPMRIIASNAGVEGAVIVGKECEGGRTR